MWRDKICLIKKCVLGWTSSKKSYLLMKIKRTFTVRLIPNPRRYEWKEVDGERYLYDKLDKVLFPGFLILQNR